MCRQLLLRVFAAILFISALPVLADPPSQAGRISHLSGNVSFRADKDDDWTPAQLNYPVTSHNAFLTNDESRLEIRVGSAAIRLDENAEVSIPQLDDDVIRVNVKRGVANVTVRSQESRNPIEILTPAGQVTLNGAGVYRFQARTDRDQVIITAFDGSASLDTGDSSVTVREGREVVVDGIDPVEYNVRNARRGPFEDWVAGRDARIDRSRSSRYVSPEIAGHEDLDEYGDWEETSDYGTVWIPRTTVSGWAPYRHGNWAWVDPWGWTWVDYAPWGFAPFHYGRWVYFDNRWGWSPGVVHARPVYAPALVAFIGRPGWSVTFATGSAPAVGWVPLGYRDLYRPSYPCSPSYVRNVNITNINVRNVDLTRVNWSNPPTPAYSLRKFPQAVTVVPQRAFNSGRPVLDQRARIAAPSNEPIATTPRHIPAPVRRIVTRDAPEPQRSAIVPSAPAAPRHMNPGQENQNQTKTWRMDQRPSAIINTEDDRHKDNRGHVETIRPMQRLRPSTPAQESTPSTPAGPPRTEQRANVPAPAGYTTEPPGQSRRHFQRDSRRADDAPRIERTPQIEHSVPQRVQPSREAVSPPPQARPQIQAPAAEPPGRMMRAPAEGGEGHGSRKWRAE